MSTLDDLRYLTEVMISCWKRPPSRTLTPLKISLGPTSWRSCSLTSRIAGRGAFGTYEFMPRSKSPEHHFDLTKFGVVSHADAMDFLQTEAWDLELQLIARKHDGILLN